VGYASGDGIYFSGIARKNATGLINGNKCEAFKPGQTQKCRYALEGLLLKLDSSQGNIHDAFRSADILRKVTVVTERGVATEGRFP
jgi:hypothetical protein